MKLTKLQRYTIYCILESEISTADYNAGLCFLIAIGLDLRLFKSDVRYTDIINSLHELKRRKTLTGAYWFNNNKERIAALKECIKETHP